MRASTHAAAALVLALLLTSCSGGAADDTASGGSPTRTSSPDASAGASASTSPAASPSAAASSSAPVPFPTPPAEGTGRAGQVAFATYVLEGWVYALNTNDPRPLLAAGGRTPCAGCGELARELRARAKAGWYVELDDVRVGRPRVRRAGGTVTVTLPVGIPESSTFFTDGRFRALNAAHPDSRFAVEIATGRSLRLVSFSLTAGR